MFKFAQISLVTLAKVDYGNMPKEREETSKLLLTCTSMHNKDIAFLALLAHSIVSK